MGYPDLKSDESIVLTAQHVKVKSVPFELVLTNRRLIIIDSEKNVVPTQQIMLFTIRNVMASENAIRDPVITLTILTDTADTREMALTFVRQTAGERRREADEWVKTLKRNIAEAAAQPAEIVMDIPVQAETRHEHPGSMGAKKKIEIARPIKKIMVDSSHLPPKPVETMSLPEGSFCGRCGNRIPPGSTFCNRCGTKVSAPGDVSTVSAVSPQVAATAPATPMGTGDRKGRPIEQIIHSIEPLIADSVPRTVTAPAMPESVTAPPAEPVPAPATPADAFAAAAAAIAEMGKDTPAVPPAGPVPPLPPVPEAPRKKSKRFIAAVIIIIVILAVVAGGFVVITNLHKSTTVTPVTTSQPTVMTTVPTLTPVVITVITTVAVPTTPQTLIPQSGVWAEIKYDKTYSGLVGVPGSQAGVSDTGDHFYRIPTNDAVAISVQKTDGSGDQLTVTLYKDGIMVKTVSTTTPKGSIDMELSVATPTPTPVLTPMPTLPLTSTTTTTVNTTTNST